MSYNFFNYLKDVIGGTAEYTDKETVNNRRKICDGCEVRNTAVDMCTACGCYLPAKLKLKLAECPLDRWPTTKQQPEQ